MIKSIGVISTEKKENSKSQFGTAVKCLEKRINEGRKLLKMTDVLYSISEKAGLPDDVVKQMKKEGEPLVAETRDELSRLEAAISFLGNERMIHDRILELEEENIKLRDRVKELEDAAAKSKSS
jgi:hypothetical protein